MSSSFKKIGLVDSAEFQFQKQLMGRDDTSVPLEQPPPPSIQIDLSGPKPGEEIEIEVTPVWLLCKQIFVRFL